MGDNKMTKQITLTEGKVNYILGGGIGSWAKSIEKNVKVGEVRFIGGMLMYACAIYLRGFWNITQEVNWCPVDMRKMPTICFKEEPVYVAEYTRMKEWVANL
mgnify:CR=1 FL=1